MHVAIRLLPLIYTCLWVLNSIPQENGSKFNEKIFYHTTSAFLENMLIFMCWHEKKPPSNMKHFNVVKLFGFVPRKYSGVCTQSSPVHFHSETMGLILEWLLDCCALQTFAVLSAGDREGVISRELFLWESPHAAPAISDALQFIQCQNWHWGAAAAASRAGIQANRSSSHSGHCWSNLTIEQMHS